MCLLSQDVPDLVTTTDRPCQPLGTSSLLWWFQKIPALSNTSSKDLVRYQINPLKRQTFCSDPCRNYSHGNIFRDLSNQQSDNFAFKPQGRGSKTVAIQHWQCLWIRPWEKLCGFSGKCVKRPQEGFWKSAKTVSVHDQPKVSRQRPLKIQSRFSTKD